MRTTVPPAICMFLLAACEPSGGEIPAPGSGGVVWGPEPCNLSVEFPGSPREKTEEIPGFGTFDSADLVSGEAVFMANCMQLTPALAAGLPQDPGELLRMILRDNAQRSGINPVQITISNEAEFISGTARGAKTVEGRGATYITKTAIKGDSVLSAVIAAPSEVFPTEGQMGFLSSVSSIQSQSENSASFPAE